MKNGAPTKKSGALLFLSPKGRFFWYNGIMKTGKLVIALGGNAIRPPAKKSKFEDQLKELEIFARSFKKIVNKYRIAITHGNGPQVGDILLQQELCKNYVSPLPLAVCDAQTQGQIGFMISSALLGAFQKSGIRKEVLTVVTQILVRRSDPAFLNPTKPVGPFYPPAEARQLRKKGILMKEISYRLWRRVVASPRPLEILEIEAIKGLVERGMIIVSCGGGGIPVIAEKGKLKSIDAVIDKDLASALLAQGIKADTLLILTNVKNVYLNFGEKNQEAIEKMSVREAKKYLSEGAFPAGSMGPKIEAVMKFLEGGGKKAVIAHLRDFLPALEGKAGTIIAK